LDAALAQKGAATFSSPQNCADCHEVEAGKTSTSAPNLHGRGSLEWIESVIKDSGKEHLFGEKAKMPKFGQKLSEEQIDQLAQLIHAKQTYAAPAVLAAH